MIKLPVTVTSRVSLSIDLSVGIISETSDSEPATERYTAVFLPSAELWVAITCWFVGSS